MYVSAPQKRSEMKRAEKKLKENNAHSPNTEKNE